MVASRLIVEVGLPTWAAITRNDKPAARPREISSDPPTPTDLLPDVVDPGGSFHREADSRAPCGSTTPTARAVRLVA
jgi:hypothetical protein